MSRWTSRRAILADLSRAQGGGSASALLPDSHPLPLGADDCPPPLANTEETEEEYFNQCIGEGEIFSKPDLRLIQQMLDMVRDQNISEDEVSPRDVVIISKLNPWISEFTPRMFNCKLDENPSKKPAELTSPQSGALSPAVPRSRKIQRNIALESILRAKEENAEPVSTAVTDKPLTLLKPADLTDIRDIQASSICIEVAEGKMETTKYTSNSSCNKTDAKLNEWMQLMSRPVQKKSPSNNILSLDPSNMFKKKNKDKTVPSECRSGAGSPALNTASTDNNLSSRNNGAYIPSEEANVYYQKYSERRKLMEAMHDDMWTSVEKKMKQIDETKRLQAEQRAAEEAKVALSICESVPEVTEQREPAGVQEDDGESEGADPLRRVCLAAPRHAEGASVPCVVCERLLARTTATATATATAAPDLLVATTDSPDRVEPSGSNHLIRVETVCDLSACDDAPESVLELETPSDSSQ